jgi:hypothetical protein
MQKWEYLFMTVGVHLSAILSLARWEMDLAPGKMAKNLTEVMAEVNRVGAEGWELVSSITGNDANGNITKTVLVFKRPKA